MGLELEAIEVEGLTYDHLKNIKWKTKTEEYIPISAMADNHLRNTALMLMGMGYQKYNCSDEAKIAWLTVFRMEWERRMMLKVAWDGKD